MTKLIIITFSLFSLNLLAVDINELMLKTNFLVKSKYPKLPVGKQTLVKKQLTNVINTIEGNGIISKPICVPSSINNSGFRIAIKGKEIGGTITFESECRELVAGRKNGIVCSANPDDDSDYSLFSLRSGQQIGGKITFKSNCLNEHIQKSTKEYVCAPTIKDNSDYAIYNIRNTNQLGSKYSFLSSCLAQLQTLK